jgi:hypothetical protein
LGTLARTRPDTRVDTAVLQGKPALAILCELRGSVFALKPPGFVTPVTLPEHSEQSVAA